VIRHVVMFSARDPRDVDAMIEGLALLTAIRHATRVEIARNIKRDRFGNDVDVVVYAEFTDEAALAAYRADPLYEESIRRVRPLRDLRVAADFSIESAVRAPGFSEA
jgi:hypothetical protein